MIKIGSDILEYQIRSGGEIDFNYWQDNHINVKAKLESSNDIMSLLLLHDVVESIMNLHIYYLPYARQDRKFSVSSPMSLRVVANLLNNLHKVNKIHLYDPHSSVAENLITKPLYVHDMRELIDHSWLYEYDVLIAPDQGAYKKLSEQFSSHDLAFAVKSRREGGLPYIEGIYGANIKNKSCLILDDICDGGRTFIELGKLCEKKGAICDLHTTYGIYSYNALDSLFQHFNTISCSYTVNYNGNDPRLDIIGDF